MPETSCRLITWAFSGDGPHGFRNDAHGTACFRRSRRLPPKPGRPTPGKLPAALAAGNGQCRRPRGPVSAALAGFNGSGPTTFGSAAPRSSWMSRSSRLSAPWLPSRPPLGTAFALGRSQEKLSYQHALADSSSLRSPSVCRGGALNPSSVAAGSRGEVDARGRRC